MLYSLLITSHIEDKQIILTDQKTGYTYEMINRLCGKVSTALRECGVKTGDRVCIMAENTLNTVVIILSCLQMGACFVPVSPKISVQTLENLVLDSRPALFIGKYSLNSVKCILSEKIFKLAEKQKGSEPEITDEDTISYILYTSGSTKAPKGVVAKEKNIIFCVEAINKRLKNTISDKILCCIPLSFDYGLYQIFLSLFSGASLLLIPNMPIAEIVSILFKEHITAFPAMPTMLNMILKTRLLSRIALNELRYITSTGDNFPVALIQQISSAIPLAEIIPMYGLTECKRVSVMPLHCKKKVLDGSCGLPLDGVKVYLDNVSSDGIGELIVCGENVMNGYWNDEEATRKCFFLNEKNERCLHTGDFFKIDSEGYLYFIGRKSTILKVNGYRIGILELENIIISEMNDLISELAVIGYPDETAGEKIAVCIVSDLSNEIIKEKLIEISYKLSLYQKPHMLYCFKSPLPKNRNAKIDRNALKEMILKNEFISLL